MGDDAIEYRGRRTRIGAFPIGIIPEGFQEPAAPSTAEEVASLMCSIAPNRLVLGVDRLDYTKGILERLEGFARLLEVYPEWRRKVSLVQISVPSRSDVPAYAEQRQRVETIVGRTNGEFGEATGCRFVTSIGHTGVTSSPSSTALPLLATSRRYATA